MTNSSRMEPTAEVTVAARRSGDEIVAEMMARFDAAADREDMPEDKRDRLRAVYEAAARREHGAQE